MKKIYLFITVFMMTLTLFAHTQERKKSVDFYAVNYSLAQDFSNENLKKVSTSYHNGKLSIVGLEKTVQIEIYNLLGKKVVYLKNVNIRGTFHKFLDLPRNNIYIVKISSSDFSKTFKIVAK
ncbi:T9SS type A sorting domain-containing protein [Kordia algicida OT-1]|uniref:Secretion system C-terminal sorting domain-containing protein n=1 Tax=Kordia algicida OT-1 TaxID=391587 RepID=A9DXG7_9FLAO|nr:T9SS type A sorting domain-containing protein [Kordia algicida]EDP96001.1 hypothetical protein KAOT1_07528 [Kordia algicida OT-1]